jgi:hypothetical protein
MIKTVQLGFAAAQNYGKKHFTTAVKATKEMSSKVTTRYKKLSGTKRAAIGGFGTGLKYGTFGVGVLAVGEGAYNIATGKKRISVKKTKKV